MHFIVPSYENPEPQLLKDWSDHTTESARGMVRLLIKYAWSDHAKLLEEINKHWHSQ